MPQIPKWCRSRDMLFRNKLPGRSTCKWAHGKDEFVNCEFWNQPFRGWRQSCQCLYFISYFCFLHSLSKMTLWAMGGIGCLVTWWVNGRKRKEEIKLALVFNTQTRIMIRLLHQIWTTTTLQCFHLKMSPRILYTIDRHTYQETGP